MTKTRVSDIDIYYEEHGDPDAEPLLLIMGFTANAGAWALQIPALAQRYRVIAFDNRGAGRTTQPDGPYTIPQMADDAAGLLDALGAGPAHIIGSSMGGMIAQEFALRHPQRVRTLTLMCTTPGGPNSFGYAEMVDYSEALDEIQDLSQMLTPELMQASIDVHFTPEFMKAPGAGFQAMIGSGIMYPSTLAGVKGQTAAIVKHDTYARLPRIAAPTLVTAGSDDTFVDARNSPLLAGRIPNAELRMFEGLRHGFAVERPDLVNPVLLEFLSKARADVRAGRQVGVVASLLRRFRRHSDHARSGKASA
jgi:pimeloyl-ACP methyl ester carboxylesterase